MNDRFVDLGDGYAWHIESDLAGVTLCGRTFAVADVEERVRKAVIDRRFDDTGDKPTYCFDCLSVRSGGSVSPSRREIHF